MGTNGGYLSNISDAERLKKLAKKRIIEASQRESVAIFIPHSWSYHEEYTRLVKLLEGDETFTFKNYSVPKDDPLEAENKKKLKEDLKNQINAASVIVIPAGMYAAHSDWIQEEIGLAKELRKPIVAVYPWGSEKMPQIVSENADEIVGWNRDSIISAIEKVRGKRIEK